MSKIVRTLHFNTNGEFINNLVTDVFFEGFDYDKCLRILKSSLMGLEQTDEQFARLAEDILLGRTKIEGSTADNTYGLNYYDANEQPIVPDNKNVWKVLLKQQQKIIQLQEELESSEDHSEYLYSLLPDYIKDNINFDDYLCDINDNTDIKIANNYINNQSDIKSYGNELLDGFMERALSASDDDYGWLEPNGTFHAVEWGEHEEWARGKLIELKLDTKKQIFSDYNNMLIEIGWVLIHNPSQGLGKIESSSYKNLTKEQRLFLFDYYTERNHSKEASLIYNDCE